MFPPLYLFVGTEKNARFGGGAAEKKTNNIKDAALPWA